jgi:translation initiation factor 1
MEREFSESSHPMRPEKPKRIDVNPAQGGLAGLGQALSGLNLGPLPEAPPASQAPQPVKVRKLGRVVLRKETAHRGGKVVIVVDQFPTSTTVATIEALARDLRKSMGTGGAVKDRTIEIHGNQPDKIRAFLKEAGYDVGGI